MQVSRIEIQSKVDEIMANAQRRFGHGVWFMEENDEGGDDDGNDEGDDEGGLLDNEADQGGDDGDSEDGGGGTDVAEIVKQVTAALEDKFDSIADRRVNALLKEARKGSQKPKEDQSDKAGDSKQESNTGDIREARLAYREYVSDEIKFLGNEEREHAMTLAQGLIHQQVEVLGADPDTAGREAAKTVAKQIKSLRKHYESRTITALKRSGALPEDARPGQPPKGPDKPGGQSGYQAGAAKAAEMFGSRKPADA